MYIELYIPSFHRQGEKAADDRLTELYLLGYRKTLLDLQLGYSWTGSPIE